MLAPSTLDLPVSDDPLDGLTARCETLSFTGLDIPILRKALRKTSSLKDSSIFPVGKAHLQTLHLESP